MAIHHALVRRRRALALASLAGLAAAGLIPAPAHAAHNNKIDQLISAMTLDEKISMLRGSVPGLPFQPATDPLANGEVGYLPGIPRLGIPPLRFTDGPAGVRITPPTTAMPAPVSLAATFSTDFARQYGKVLGHDAQATNNDVIFAPMINLVRVPYGGRDFETLGEDPFLMSRIVVPEMLAIQREGTIATPKHFAENNQETNRQGIDVNVDERTLNEIELPAFEASVKAGAGSVMCAYNQVNGHFSCENPTLLTDILRKRWGFDDFVVSDYGANQSVVPALNAGMGVEFLSQHFGDPKSGLKAAVTSGQLPVSVVDRAVRGILNSMERFGLLKGASPTGGTVIQPERPQLDVEADAQIAREVATAGAVLLKNDGVLPLSGGDLGGLVVIGATARQLLVGGGGSSQVEGFKAREKSPLTALTELAGPAANITFKVGIDLDGVLVPASVLSPQPPPGGGGQGLLRTNNVTGATQIDPQINFTGANALPVGSDVAWTGTITVPTAGDYEFKIQTDPSPGLAFDIGVGTGTVSVDNVQLGQTVPFLGNLSRLPTTDGLANAGGHITLSAGPHAIKVAGTTAGAFIFPPSTNPLQIRLAWITPEQRQQNLADAAAAAHSANAALVFVHEEGSEGVDRPSLSLPLDQDGLIRAVTAATRRAAVVINSGYPVAMPWVDGSNAILQMWYPGQEGGTATAELLLGHASPSGKLPVTFPRSEADTPVAGHPERFPGLDLGTANARQFYSEGIFVGYRWYDANGIQPLFPFGHGLSYTRFDYSELKVERAGDGFEVSFRVRNVGQVKGAEVPQVYLGPPSPAPVSMAPKQLVGFERVELGPGKSEKVKVHIGARQLSYWSTVKHDWVVARGERPVYVGSSSGDIRLQGQAKEKRGAD
jgi:beta-glucosidase